MAAGGSILSFQNRGPWGDPGYRGNCSGHVYREIFEWLHPCVFTDPMVGGGTSVEIAREMHIEAHGFDLHSGFNILNSGLSRWWASRPTWCCRIRRITTSWSIAAMCGAGDLIQTICRAAPSEEEFLDKLTIALKNQRHATRLGGFYGVIIGDVRKNGVYSSYQADLIVRMPKKELRQVLIKQQHNVASNVRDYPLRLPRIMHEYVVLWQRQRRAVVARPAKNFVGVAPAQRLAVT